MLPLDQQRQEVEFRGEYSNIRAAIAHEIPKWDALDRPQLFIPNRRNYAIFTAAVALWPA